MSTNPIALAILLTTSAISLGADVEHQYLKAFPPAEEGMVRYAIVLPEKERGEDDAYRVELVVGKTIETDGVNTYRIGGEMKEQPLKGWGFSYYEVKKLGEAASTLKGVPPGTPPVKKFVHGPAKLIGYNSRVPVILYVPEGAEVRYRIFKAGKEKTAKKG